MYILSNHEKYRKTWKGPTIPLMLDQGFGTAFKYNIFPTYGKLTTEIRMEDQ